LLLRESRQNPIPKDRDDMKLLYLEDYNQERMLLEVRLKRFGGEGARNFSTTKSDDGGKGAQGERSISESSVMGSQLQKPDFKPVNDLGLSPRANSNEAQESAPTPPTVIVRLNGGFRRKESD